MLGAAPTCAHGVCAASRHRPTTGGRLRALRSACLSALVVVAVCALAGAPGAAARETGKLWAVAPSEQGLPSRTALAQLRSNGVNAVVVDATKVGRGSAGARHVESMWRLTRAVHMWLLLVDPRTAPATPAVRRALALCSNGATAIRCADVAPSAAAASRMASASDRIRPLVALYASRPGAFTGLRAPKPARRRILVIAPLYSTFEDSVWGPAIATAAASPGVDLAVAPTSTLGSAPVQRFGASLGGSATATGAGADTDSTPPSAPTVGLDSVGSSSAIVSWLPSTDNVGVAAYRVYANGARVADDAKSPATVAGLTCGVPVTIGVEAIDAAGNASYRSTVGVTPGPCGGGSGGGGGGGSGGGAGASADTTPPTAPLGLAVSSIGRTSLTFSWNPSSDDRVVTGYRVYRNGTLVDTSLVTNYLLGGLTCGTTYTLGVAAVDGSGNASFTSIQSARTTACDTTPPSSPSGLATSSVSQTAATLSWGASTDDTGVAGYRLTLGGNQVASVGGTNYTFTGLACGTSYTLGVAALDDAGNASNITSKNVTTQACAGDATAPSAPTGLTASGVSQTQATLSWTASTDNVAVTGYRTYRGGSQVGTTSSTSYTFTGLTCGTSYSLGVAALDAAGNVSLTASGSVTTAACPDTTPPSTPSTLATTGVTQTQVTLSWSAATDNVGVTGYRTFRNGTHVGSPSTTGYTYTGLACATTYTLGVAAVDAAANASSTATTTVTTSACPDTVAPSVPVGLLTSGVGQSSVGLSWNVSTDNVGVAGYRLFLNGTQVGTSVAPSFIFGGLNCGTGYTLGVAAVDAAGNVSATASTRVTAAACASPPPPSSSSSASVAVSPAGSDLSCVRGDLSRPCLSLNRAYALALCGDTVQVADGSYGAQSISGSKACTAASPVKFLPASGQPLFSDVAVHASYVWIEGMKVPHSLTATSVGDWDVSAPSPSLPSAVSYVTLKNDEGGRLYIYGEHVDLLGGSYGGFNSCLVGGEDVANIWQQPDTSGSYYASSYVTLDGVTIHDGTDNGNLCAGYPNAGVHVDALQILGGHHITIRNSFFYNCPTSCIIGSGFRTGEDNYLIENNFFQQEAQPGATLNFSYSASGDPATGTNMVIRYNTTNGSISTGCTSSSPGCWSVYGNIVAYANCGPGSSWKYNLIGTGSCGTTNKTGSETYAGPTPQGSFGSTTIPDFHLKPTDTLAKNAGDPSNYPATDHDQNPRPQGGTPDAGANEIG